MIDGLLKISEILLGRSDKLREADAVRRKRVSLYFENVSRCLSDIAVALRTGTEPWQACEELETYSDEANPLFDKYKESLIATVYGKQLAKEVGLQLSDMTYVRGGAVLRLSRIKSGERFYVSDLGVGKSPQEILDESIIKIEKAAGKFKALSVLAATLDR